MAGLQWEPTSMKLPASYKKQETVWYSENMANTGGDIYSFSAISFIHSLPHPSIHYLLNIYYVPNSPLGAENTVW